MGYLRLRSSVQMRQKSNTNTILGMCTESAHGRIFFKYFINKLVLIESCNKLNKDTEINFEQNYLVFAFFANSKFFISAVTKRGKFEF